MFYYAEELDSNKRINHLFLFFSFTQKKKTEPVKFSVSTNFIFFNFKCKVGK